MRMVGVAGGFELVGKLLRLVRSAAPQRLPSAAHLIIGTAGVIPPESNPSSAAEEYGHPEESQQDVPPATHTQLGSSQNYLLRSSKSTRPSGGTRCCKGVSLRSLYLGGTTYLGGFFCCSFIFFWVASHMAFMLCPFWGAVTSVCSTGS